MKPSGLAPKGTPKRLVQEAQIAWQRRDLNRCVEMLEKATREVPDAVDLLLWLGGVHGQQYSYDSADQAFERAYRAAQPERKAEALIAAAQQAKNFFDAGVAEKYFKRALEEPGATPEMFVSKAEFCNRQRSEEAQALVDQALKLDETCETAWLVRARLQAKAGHLEQAEGGLRRLLDRTTTNEIRIRAGSELGAVLDRLGRYDEAMEAFVETKNLLRPALEAQIAPREFMRKQLARMRTQISEELLDRWFESGRELQPCRRLAILSGHPGSGTMLMGRVLDAHSDIVSIEERTHFSDYAFSPLKRRWPADTPILKVLDDAPKELLTAYRDRYFQTAELCLGNPIGTRLLIDTNPALTVMVPAVARFFPEARFAVMVRDPRDVVLSCFLQPVLSVQQASYPYTSLNTIAESYANLMQTWQTVEPILPNPHSEVRFEELLDDLPTVTRRTLDFLQVPWDESIAAFEEHARGKIGRSQTYADVDLEALKQTRGQWQNYQKHLEPHLHILEPFVKALGYE